MNKIFLFTAWAVLLFASCNHAKNHHGHDHPHGSECAHDHDHEGHNHDNDDHDGHDHEDNASSHSDEIVFTSEQAAKANIGFYTVKPVDFHEVITTSGEILPAQGDEATLVATVSGIVLFGSVKPIVGGEAKKDTPLFYISSKNISEGDYIARSRAAYEQALAAFNRAEKLVKEQIISQREFEQARYDYETARTAYEALGHSASEQGTKIAAPFSGFISTILVREGDYVNVGDPMAVVSQNRRLILQADVSQRHYRALQTISTANFKASYNDKVYSLKELNGKMRSFGKSVSGKSGYIPVSFEFDNPGDVISGSFVTIFLISAPLKEVLTIPLTSLTENQGAYFVYVRTGDEHYEKREVSLGGNDGVKVLIHRGLEPGEVIVSEGAYQIRLASVSGAIPEGHSHNH